MANGLTAITQNTDCQIFGGATAALLVPYDGVNGVVVSSRIISEIQLKSGYSWVQWTFDENEAYATFTEQPDGIFFNGEGLLRFDKITAAKRTALNGAKRCCGLVIIWQMRTGENVVQGIDVAPDNSWSFSSNKPVVRPTFNHRTQAGIPQIEVSIPHRGKWVSTTIDQTFPEILAGPAPTVITTGGYTIGAGGIVIGF